MVASEGAEWNGMDGWKEGANEKRATLFSLLLLLYCT